jgi:hypothetical protein
MDLMLIYMREIRAEAKKRHVSVTDALDKYLDAYHIHRTANGSYRDITSQYHYMQKMHERYRFMRITALEFIAEQTGQENKRRDRKNDKR